jgi:hypothetical protein
MTKTELEKELTAAIQDAKTGQQYLTLFGQIRKTRIDYASILSAKEKAVLLNDEHDALKKCEEYCESEIIKRGLERAFPEEPGQVM